MGRLNHIYENILIEARRFGKTQKDLVFGSGKKNTLMLIGEAPGAEEIRLSRPFVGRAGKNLDMFLNVLGVCRADIYITNVVKFRPFTVSAKGTLSNRPPTKQEINAMLPYLLQEIEQVCPKVVVTLGNVPLKSLLGNDKRIGECHAVPARSFALSHKFELFPLYHPASVIYNRELKTVYDNDINALKSYLEELRIIKTDELPENKEAL
ncbi:MAG: uracil-DNA glycosylase [Christensenellales bacterium]